MKNQLNDIEKKALNFIRNKIVHGDLKPTIRNLMKFLGYQSPRSASLIITSLIEKGCLIRDDVTKEIKLLKFAGDIKKNIPLVGNIACGQPILATQNIEAYIPYDVKGDVNDYFFLRALGDSMDRSGINDGDLVLIKKQQTAESGDQVVALIGGEATIKIFRPEKDKIVLEPKSSNPIHKPIYLFEEIQIQGKVVGILNINK
ncbi:MAG: repressor LexA [Bacteroidales bacterium]|nr:repressor LexA [Bacteroidales bacterium]